MNLKSNLLLLVVIISGCAGSPLHTSSMSSNELRNVDDYTLCKAATPRELYDPSGSVIMEVRRRGLDCRSMYTYTPTPVIVVPQTQQQPRMPTQTTCYRNGQYVNCTTN
jgi:hypothetical protein